MNKPELINQPNNYGCGFACIAMIARIDYDEAEAMYGKPVVKSGINDNIIWYLLSHLGYSSRIVLRAWAITESWPIEVGTWDIWRISMPTAVSGGHYVLRHNDNIYDPAHRTIKSIEDYSDPVSIIGVENG